MSESSQKKNDYIYKAHMTRAGLTNTLSAIIDLKDPYTARHCEFVAKCSLLIGKELKLPDGQLKKLEQAAILHDIGKIMVDVGILNKCEPLTDREMMQIRTHAEKGMRILTLFGFSNFVVDAAWHHHEQWDGSGYPDGLKGNSINPMTRIVSISDSVAAMAEDRPYKIHLADEDIVKELEKGKRKQFEPELADVVISMIKEKKLSQKILSAPGLANDVS